MDIDQTLNIFYVHRTFTEGENVQKFIRELLPRNGHQSYEEARQWIKDYGNNQSEYVILEVFKRP